MSKQVFYATITVTGTVDSAEIANKHALTAIVASVKNTMKAIISSGELEQSGTSVVHVGPHDIAVHGFATGGFMDVSVSGLEPAAFSKELN